jgi:hypothetical protein
MTVQGFPACCLESKSNAAVASSRKELPRLNKKRNIR